MSKEIKTNAMRLLDKAGIAYRSLSYEIAREDFSGEAVSRLLGVEADACFKTLALTHGKDLYILCVPVNREVDLKKAAVQIGVKKLEMLPVKELLGKVGYERGSVSPIGISSGHRTFFDEEIILHEEIEISAGKFGLGLLVKSEHILSFLEAEIKDLCHEKSPGK